jgi:transposase
VAARPDITLVELQTLLAEHRVAVAVSTLWRFFARRKITLKKSPHMRRSRTVPTS